MAGTEMVLPLEGGTVMRASDQCSAALWRKLTDGEAKPAEAARVIARTPALLEEARRLAPMLAERAKAMGAEMVMARLIQLGPTYGLRDLSDGEWAALFRTYLDVLEDLPEEAFEAGVVAYAKEGVFFPKPAEIFKPADKVARDLRMAAYRSKLALEHQEAEPVRQRTAAEREADIQEAIRLGFLTPDRKPVLDLKRVPTDDPPPAKPYESRAEMAAHLRTLQGPAARAEDEPEEII